MCLKMKHITKEIHVSSIKHLLSSGALRISYVILSILRERRIMVTCYLADAKVVLVQDEYTAKVTHLVDVKLKMKPRLSLLSPC